MCCTLNVVCLTTALNLLWGLLAVIAFGTYARLEARGGLGARHRAGWRRFSAVAIVVVALFPCISASDDILGFAMLMPRGQQNSSVEDLGSLQLASLLLSLDHVRITPVFALLLAVSFFGMVTLTRDELPVQRRLCRQWRAPPRP